MPKPSIGFIGLGLMGSAMCSRLLDCEYPLTVIANRSRENVDKAVSRGAMEVSTARALAERSDIIMLCMDTSQSVEARMTGDDGVISGMRDGAIAIDFGTSLPASTRMLGEQVSARGGYFLDAPLGRTPSHALEGKLNIMCAGEVGAYERAKPVLEDVGENVFHLGVLGSGHTIKLINNFFGMTTATAMSEAFAMADLAGVERQKLYDVMAAGPLHSGMMDFVSAYALEGKPDALAFAIKNASKDVGYYGQMVEAAGATSIISPAAANALKMATDAGRGDQMVSQMVDYFSEQMSGRDNQ